MKRIRELLKPMLAATLSAVLLAGCGQMEQINIEIEEEQTEEKQAEDTWLQTYVSSASVISGAEETVLFQQECDGGFLAYINRKVREEIPEEYREDPDFVNDGRYDVYESALFTVSKSGKRHKVRRYRPLPAPENTENLENYFSETRPRAFRVREDGCIAVLESSYEAWLAARATQTRDRYYIRLLKDNGVELSCAEIETVPGEGLSCGETVFLPGNMVAVPQGQEVLFFGFDGKKLFSVSTPFPIRELCGTREGKLAVVLNDRGSLWMSVIDPTDRTATVPLRVPEGAHSFCAGGENSLWFLRNSDLLSYDLMSGTAEKHISLVTLGVAPSTVGAFFAGTDGRFHFLLHNRNDNGTSVEEQYLIASPCEIPTERLLVRIGYENISDHLIEAILGFNKENRDIFLEAVDYRNIETGITADNLSDITVMDETIYGRLQTSESLMDLLPMLRTDRSFSPEDLFDSVRNALADENGALRRLAGSFRIETMACDGITANGKTDLNLTEMRSLLADMPAKSLLYEPYYTAEQLMNDLCAVNKKMLGKGDAFNAGLYAELLNYSNLQPASYSYHDYAADSSSMESRVYGGRLLMIQAYIATLDDLKWYDAFFEHGASFVGWPTQKGSASRFCFDECLGISSACSEEIRRAAWQFVRLLISEEYMKTCYGFPAVKKALENKMTEDAANVAYRIDEKGKYETDKNGKKIEIARDSWYSPDWRRHFIYALTGTQRQKLLTMIDHSV